MNLKNLKPPSDSKLADQLQRNWQKIAEDADRWRSRDLYRPQSEPNGAKA